LLKLRHTCFDGTRGSNIVNADGAEVGSIQFQGSSPTRYAALPADTPRVEGARVRASLRCSLVQPCFYMERTNANSFRGSIAGLRSAYCDSPAIKGARMLCTAFANHRRPRIAALTVMLSQLLSATRGNLRRRDCARVGPFKIGAALRALIEAIRPLFSLRSFADGAHDA
jgi:hypothetical protein